MVECFIEDQLIVALAKAGRRHLPVHTPVRSLSRDQIFSIDVQPGIHLQGLGEVITSSCDLGDDFCVGNEAYDLGRRNTQENVRIQFLKGLVSEPVTPFRIEYAAGKINR